MSFKYDRSEKKFNCRTSPFADGTSTVGVSVLSPAGREEGDAAASQEGIIYIPAVIKRQLNGSYYRRALLNQ